MKSGELPLAPAPLSVRIQNEPSAMRLMPEWPCSGWPLNGRETPVGRPADVPSTEPVCSTRLAVVNLPLVCRSAGAFFGAATKLWAGKTAWPASVAGKACWAWAEPRAAQASVAQNAMRVMENMWIGDQAKGPTMPAPLDTPVTRP